MFRPSWTIIKEFPVVKNKYIKSAYVTKIDIHIKYIKKLVI